MCVRVRMRALAHPKEENLSYPRQSRRNSSAILLRGAVSYPLRVGCCFAREPLTWVQNKLEPSSIASPRMAAQWGSFWRKF